MQRAARMKRELQIFQQSPPHGISCWSCGDSIELLEARILGGEGTPYESGVFKLEIQLPERYPFEPPKVKFVTQIYHPNIDNAGRICLDILKMPPKGAWRPSLNLSTVLTSVQLLMAEPNPEDPLMTDIANEFKYSKSVFEEKAKRCTKEHATSGACQKEQEPNAGNCENKMAGSGDSAKTAVESTSDCQKTEKRPAPDMLPLQENVKKTKS